MKTSLKYFREINLTQLTLAIQ